MDETGRRRGRSRHRIQHETREQPPPEHLHTSTTADQLQPHAARREREAPELAHAGPDQARQPTEPGNQDPPPGAAGTSTAAAGCHAVAVATAPPRSSPRDAPARRFRPGPISPRAREGSAPPPPITSLWPAAPSGRRQGEGGVEGGTRGVVARGPLMSPAGAARRGELHSIKCHSMVHLLEPIHDGY
jgi:hypothetical protein